MPVNRNEIHPFLWIVAAAILLLGLWLRLDQLTGQWLMDDEWHAIHKLQQSSGYADIFSSFGHADYSIPLTAFYKFLAQTVGLSELRMRFPMLVAGICLPIMAAAWAWRSVSPKVGLVFGFLLATSPMLINYSRTARPYSLTLLLSLISVFLLLRYLNERRLCDALIYVGIAGLAVYLHPITAPFFLSSVGSAVAYIHLARGGSAACQPLLLLLGLIFAVGLIVVPPIVLDQGAMSGKLASSQPGIGTVWGALHMWLGTSSPIVVFLSLALAVIGTRMAIKAHPGAFGVYLSGLAGILVAILVLQPAWVHNPLTFARYLLPSAPLLAWLISLGTINVASWFNTKWHAYVICMLLLVSCVGSPLPALLRAPNNLTLHSYYQFDYRSDHSLVRAAMPELSEGEDFWRFLSSFEPGSLRIAIAGESSFESYANPGTLHQSIHRQALAKLQTGRTCGGKRKGEAYPDESIFLRNAVSLGSKNVLMSQGIDLIVFDMQLIKKGIGAPKDYFSSPSYTLYHDSCIAWLYQHFDAPMIEGEYLLIFDVSGRVKF